VWSRYCTDCIIVVASSTSEEILVVFIGGDREKVRSGKESTCLVVWSASEGRVIRCDSRIAYLGFRDRDLLIESLVNFPEDQMFGITSPSYGEPNSKVLGGTPATVNCTHASSTDYKYYEVTPSRAVSSL
jgi:hypothetical protein